MAGALDPDFSLPDTRLLAVPRSEADREHAFPSKQAASWGNATFLALCMKVAYEVSASGLSANSCTSLCEQKHAAAVPSSKHSTPSVSRMRPKVEK